MANIAVSMHVAALQGWWYFLSGRRDVIWQHDRAKNRNQDSGIRNQQSVGIRNQ
jgi:hypothetical protein